MVFKIIFLAMLAGVIALLVFDSLPSNTEFANCYSKMRSNVSRIKNISRDRGWEIDRLCKTTRTQIVNDKTCVEQVNKSRITAQYVFKVSPNRTSINKVIRDYNSMCLHQELPLYELDITKPQPSS